MPRAPWLLAALAPLALVVGCRPDKLDRTSGELQVQTRALLFPDTYVGFPTQRPIKLANTSPATRRARVVVDGPFSAPAEVSVPGGTVAEVVLTFAPAAPGLASGTVHLESEGQTADVLVSASAVMPPDCGEPPPCVDRRFDPGAGRCVESNRPEGSDCAQGNGCLEAASCQGGVCVGRAKDCDDHNPCTADLCDPGQGCVHNDLSASCPAPSEPCRVAFCDPESGCGSTDAPDGTVCGSVDCVTAHVCLLGSCQAVSVPEGTQCSPPTPCQGAGACHGGECVQPDAGPMVPAWTYGADAGVNLYFPGVTDDSDNLLWVECVIDCELVSATPTGVIRFRSRLAAPFPYSDYSLRGRLVAGAGAVVLTDGTGHLEAHAARDGALLWSLSAGPLLGVELPDGGPAQPDAPLGSWSTGPVLLNGSRALIPARYTFADGRSQPYLTHLISLETSTGRLLGDNPIDGYLSSPVGDGAGGFWTQGWLPPESDAGDGVAMVAYRLQLGPGGEVRWKAPDPSARNPGAAWGGWLFTADSNGGVRDPGPLDGGESPMPDGGREWVYSPNWYGWYGWYGYGADQVSPVIDDQAGFALTTLPPPPCGDPDAGVVCDVPYVWGPIPAVVGFSPSTGEAAWTLSLDEPESYTAFSAPVLTQRGTLLVATGGEPYWEMAADAAMPPTSAHLHEVTAGGLPLYSCPLAVDPSGNYYDYLGGTALTRGRWTVARGLWSGQARIEAYDVFGAVPAPHGWVGVAGSPGQTGSPR